MDSQELVHEGLTYRRLHAKAVSRLHEVTNGNVNEVMIYDAWMKMCDMLDAQIPPEKVIKTIREEFNEDIASSIIYSYMYFTQ